MSKDLTICQVDFTSKSVINEFKTIQDAVDKYPQFKALKNGINLCLNDTRKSSYVFGWIYKWKLEEITMEKYLSDRKVKKRKKLLVDSFPNLTKEWNFSKNTYIDIQTISFSSNIKVWWICLNNKDHPTYYTSINHRTRINIYGCKECYIDSLRVLGKKEKESHISKHINNNIDIKTGDESEEYICNLLKLSDQFINIERTGQTSDKADCIVTLKSGIKKSLQVKTLTFKKSPDSYSMTNNCIYQSNMLIVMVNKERTRFALEFFGNINVKGLTLNFDYKKCKYKNIMFTDEKLFLSRLLELLPYSSDYLNFESSQSNTKEFESLKRLRIWCEKRGLNFKRNDTNGNTVDCFINNIPIQAKFSSLNVKKGLTYYITTKKSCGYLNGIRVRRHYSANDPFEYIVIEIGGTNENPTKYLGYFCFLSKQVLIEQDVLETETCKGKDTVCICPPDYPKSHWSKPYWQHPDPYISNQIEIVSSVPKQLTSVEPIKFTIVNSLSS